MGQAEEPARIVYCGDNLHILRTELASESIDLIYLDPPFYSQRNYQACFKGPVSPLAKNGSASAFGDTWYWTSETARAYKDLVCSAPGNAGSALRTFYSFLGESSLLAYLVMMGERLIELRRVLKSSGSVYLHCDSAASHYLKVLLDAIFGAENFRNEIVWFYKTGGASRRYFAKKHDLIFFYTKSNHYTFHALKEKSYMMHRYGFKKSEFLHDERGEYTWVYMKDVWNVPALGAADGQRLGYPTQKPEALLERIVQASSQPGDIVLDPFCGSGTSLVVAQRLGRGWIGIEQHYLALAYQRYRLARNFPGVRYSCRGGPCTLAEAHQLASTDVTQFRWWALSLVGARPGSEEEHVQRMHGVIPACEESGIEQWVVVIKDRAEWESWWSRCAQQASGARWSWLIIMLKPDELLSQEILRIAPSQVNDAVYPGALRMVSIAALLVGEY